jgi:hypothetical protein
MDTVRFKHTNQDMISTYGICTRRKNPYLDKGDDLKQALAEISKSNRFIIMAPAENDEQNMSNLSNVIAEIDNILIVGGYRLSRNIAGELDPKSNYGKGVDIYTPSVDVLSVGVTNEVMVSSGTSASMAGWIASIIELYPNITISDIRSLIHCATQITFNDRTGEPFVGRILNVTNIKLNNNC